MNVLVINGPNLNLLGERCPDIYGSDSLDALMKWLKKSEQGKFFTFKFYQSNHEGVIIDTIQNERLWADAILINAGAYSHYSYAIRDAIESVKSPTVEVHLSDITKREKFREFSVLSDVCIAHVYGLGKKSYLRGLEIIKEHLDE